jgi:hypothetical protein
MQLLNQGFVPGPGTSVWMRKATISILHHDLMVLFFFYSQPYPESHKLVRITGRDFTICLKFLFFLVKKRKNIIETMLLDIDYLVLIEFKKNFY